MACKLTSSKPTRMSSEHFFHPTMFSFLRFRGRHFKEMLELLASFKSGVCGGVRVRLGKLQVRLLCSSPLIWFVQCIDCTQSLSFLLVIERLEWARCATARETGVSKVDGRAVLPPHSPRGCASRSLQSLNYCGRDLNFAAMSKRNWWPSSRLPSITLFKTIRTIVLFHANISLHRGTTHKHQSVHRNLFARNLREITLFQTRTCEIVYPVKTQDPENDTHDGTSMDVCSSTFANRVHILQTLVSTASIDHLDFLQPHCNARLALCRGVSCQPSFSLAAFSSWSRFSWKCLTTHADAVQE